jgi:hypothetical protein
MHAMRSDDMQSILAGMTYSMIQTLHSGHEKPCPHNPLFIAGRDRIYLPRKWTYLASLGVARGLQKLGLANDNWRMTPLGVEVAAYISHVWETQYMYRLLAQKRAEDYDRHYKKYW